MNQHRFASLEKPKTPRPVLSRKLIHTSGGIDEGGVFSKPVTKHQWFELNKHLFLSAKIALRPSPDSTEMELKAWKDFQNWLRFHKPPFDAMIAGPWLDRDRDKDIKVTRIVY